MKIGSFLTYCLIPVIIFLLIGPKLHAQVKKSQIQITAAPAGNSKDKFTISPPTGTLNFGEFVNVNGGTVTLDPCSNGSTTPSGNIIKIRNGSTTTFTVSSTLGASQGVTLTVLPVTPINLNKGAETLTLSNLSVCINGISIPPPYTFTVGSKFDPPTIISLGGDLSVPAGASAGTYVSPSFTVSIQ